MRTSLPFLLLVGSLALLAGCEAAPARVTGALLVPSAAIRGTDIPAGYLLPTGSLAEVAIPREQRVAFAPPVAEASAYTIYTYDAQPIGLPDGYGYRYRYVFRQGITLP